MLLAQKKSCMCSVWNIGSFWAVSVSTEGHGNRRRNRLRRTLCRPYSTIALLRTSQHRSRVGIADVYLSCYLLPTVVEATTGETPRPQLYKLSITYLRTECICQVAIPRAPS